MKNNICLIFSLSINIYQEFKYSTAEKLQSLPFSAVIDSYSGGGYVYKVFYFTNILRLAFYAKYF